MTSLKYLSVNNSLFIVYLFFTCFFLDASFERGSGCHFYINFITPNNRRNVRTIKRGENHDIMNIYCNIILL